MTSLRKITYSLLCLFLFLLPWQTRWVYQPAFINGQFWEYGSASWYATEVLLWLIIILFTAANFGRKEFWQKIFSRVHYPARKKRLWLVLFFLAFWLVNILFSADWAISYNFFFRVLEVLCLGIVIIYFQNNYNGRQNFSAGNNHFHWSLWSGGVVQGLFALYQFFAQRVPHIPGLGLAAHYPFELGANVIETAHERWLRAYGSLGGANPLGIYLAVIFFIGLLMYWRARPWQKIILTAGQAFILIGLFFSFSRGAWIAAVAGAVCFIAVIARSEARAKRRRNAQRSEAIPLVIASIAPCPPLAGKQSPVDCRVPRRDVGVLAMTLKQIIFSILILTVLFFISQQIIITRFNPAARLETQSLVERQNQIRQVWQIFKQHPLLGVGPGAYTLTLYQLNPRLPAGKLLPAHNIYLLSLAEVGILGALVFAFTIGWFIKKIFQADPLYLSVLAALLAAGLFEHWLWDLYVGQLFFGIIIALGFRLKLDEN